MTFGEIRRRVESKLHREVGVAVSREQITLIRRLAVLVAEGKMSTEQALAMVRHSDRLP